MVSKDGTHLGTLEKSDARAEGKRLKRWRSIRVSSPTVAEYVVLKPKDVPQATPGELPLNGFPQERPWKDDCTNKFPDQISRPSSVIDLYAVR